MAKFKYFEPADLAEALSLLQNYGDEGGYGNAFYAGRESDQGLTSTAARRFKRIGRPRTIIVRKSPDESADEEERPC